MPETSDTRSSTIEVDSIIALRHQALVIETLSNLGYAALIRENDQRFEHTPTTDSTQPPYHFADITSPGNLIYREHLEDAAKRRLGPSLRGLTYAFGILVDQGGAAGRLGSWDVVGPGPYKKGVVQLRDPQPLPGVTLSRRSDTGVNSYTGTNNITFDAAVIAEYGILAGSIPDSIIRAQRLAKVGPNTIKNLGWLSAQLIRQFDSHK